MMIHSISKYTKIVLLYETSFYPEPDSSDKKKVELDLPNYVTSSELKETAGINTSKFAKKVELLKLKLNIYRLGIDKLGTTILSNTVKIGVVKETVYDELV